MFQLPQTPRRSEAACNARRVRLGCCISGYLVPGADLVAGLLVVPSIIGEFWIVGDLIVVGVHDNTSHPTSSLEFSAHPEAAS